MAFLYVLLFIVSTIEIWFMVRKRQKREIIVFIAIALLSLVLGYYYSTNPFRESFAQRILSVLGKEF